MASGRKRTSALKYLAFITLLALPSVEALECGSIAQREYCEEIMRSNITAEEKEYLLSDIISATKHYPDHALVEQWNRNIPLNMLPAGIMRYDRGVIRNAGVSIISVLPAVMFEGKMYLATQGTVLTAFAYELAIPEGAEQGDCRTEHIVLEKTERNMVFVNDVEQRHDVPAAFPEEHQEQVVITAEYSVAVLLEIRHYQAEKYRQGKTWRLRCSFHHAEYRKDEITLRDEIMGFVHNPHPEASFTVTDRHMGSAVGTFEHRNDVNTNLDFTDSFLHTHNYVFHETVGSKGELVINAVEEPSVEQNNLIFRDNTVMVQNTQGCRLAVADFFTEHRLPCHLEYERKKFIVTTDKAAYSEHEPITISIMPEGNYTVEYAGKEYSFPEQLEAVYPYNRITVQSEGRTVVKMIHVGDSKSLNSLFSLGLFGSVQYILVTLLKRYGGGFSG